MGGFTPTGIDRLRRVLAGHVERGGVPGLVALVDRGGQTDEVRLGAAAVGGPPLARDAIFRISSMTKPVTAVAALTLVEDCVLRLDEPVDDLLPELADRRVLRTLSAELDDTVPARRPISVRDLLTFTMGFGQLMAEPSAYPVLAAAQERKIGMGPPDPVGTPAPDEWLRRLGELPLMWQPGERWAYNTSADVLGVLIARASGRSLGDYLGERVFGPAGMVDTGFSVPAGSLDRLVTAYRPDPGTGGLSVIRPGGGGVEPAAGFDSGAAGWCRLPRTLIGSDGCAVRRRAVAVAAFARGDGDRPAHAGAAGGRGTGCRSTARAGGWASGWRPPGPGRPPRRAGSAGTVGPGQQLVLRLRRGPRRRAADPDHVDLAGRDGGRNGLLDRHLRSPHLVLRRRARAGQRVGCRAGTWRSQARAPGGAGSPATFTPGFSTALGSAEGAQGVRKGVEHAGRRGAGAVRGDGPGQAVQVRRDAAAVPGSSPPASSAPPSPDSTSPLPAVASQGVPVGLTQAGPSGPRPRSRRP